MRGARISLWCAVLEALWTRSTSWTGMRCFSCRRGMPGAAFCSGRPRGSAVTCSGCGMRTSSSYSGVLGAAGWSHDRAKRLRAGHDVVGSYRARTMEATRRRARPGPRTCYSAARKKRERIGARERQHDEPPHTHGAREMRAEGVAHTLPTHYERDATAGTREAYGTHT
jgi:hypothetical protein